VLSRLQAHYEERKVKGDGRREGLSTFVGWVCSTTKPFLGSISGLAVVCEWEQIVLEERFVLREKRERGTEVSASGTCMYERYLSRDSHGDRKDIRGGQFQELVDLTVHHITALLGQEGQA